MNVANMHQQGLGCDQDLQKAAYYYELASETNAQAKPMLEAVRAKVLIALSYAR
jgi:TPR repeat protein